MRSMRSVSERVQDLHRFDDSGDAALGGYDCGHQGCHLKVLEVAVERVRARSATARAAEALGFQGPSSEGYRRN